MSSALEKKKKRLTKVTDVTNIPKDLIDLISPTEEVERTNKKPIPKKKKEPEVIDGSVYYKSKAELVNSIHEDGFRQFKGYNDWTSHFEAGSFKAKVSNTEASALTDPINTNGTEETSDAEQVGEASVVESVVLAESKNH